MEFIEFGQLDTRLDSCHTQCGFLAWTSKLAAKLAAKLDAQMATSMAKALSRGQMARPHSWLHLTAHEVDQLAAWFTF